MGERWISEAQELLDLLKSRDWKDEIACASEQLKNDISFISLLKYGAVFLKYASVESRSDKAFALAAIIQNAEAVYYIDDKLLRDRMFVKIALQKNHKLFRYLPVELRHDIQFIKEVCNDDYYFICNQLDDNDKCIAIELAKINPEALRWMPLVMNNNPEVVFEAVRHSGKTMEYASDELKGNMDFARRAVTISPEAYDYISETLKANESFAREFGREPINHSTLREQLTSMGIDDESDLDWV